MSIKRLSYHYEAAYPTSSSSFPTPSHRQKYFDNFDSTQDFDGSSDDADLEDALNIPYNRSRHPFSTHPPVTTPATGVAGKDSAASQSSPERGRSIRRQPYFHEPSASPPSSSSPSTSPAPPPFRGAPTVNQATYIAPPIQDTMSWRTDVPSPPTHGETRYEEPTPERDQFPEQANSVPLTDMAEDVQGSFDLRPPPPTRPLENMEYLSERLFSSDHLKVILKDSTFSSRFNSFLSRYRPDSLHSLQQYVNVQKALSAVEYANALAESVSGPGFTAAHLEDDFEDRMRESVDELVNDALPGYVTHRLVQIVTEVLVKEITGRNTPIMRELVAGLAEVYCLTDPALPDNPIVYASEEFYRCTQYGKNYVVGRNCRFLQGPKSSGSSVQRLIDALSEGQEICETILNYRRDGSPFMNLLMIAPLYDNKGAVRYFIGAQVDVSGLIEGGRGLDSFEKLLHEDRGHDRYGGRGARVGVSPGEKLKELAGMLDQSDFDNLSASSNGKMKDKEGSSGSTTPVRGTRLGPTRRFIGMDDPTDKGLWPSPSLGPSGRLPGVFQNYLLIRPYPSLRITFTSPALRIPGLLQSKFLDRIGGGPRIRDQILDALSSGIGVTAKISWLPQPNNSDSNSGIPMKNTSLGNSGSAYDGDGGEGKQRWIHCTPLLGSDEKVGVWMVVMVENEPITGALNANEKREREAVQNQRGIQQSQQQNPKQDIGSYSNGTGQMSLPDRSGRGTHPGGSRTNKMYQEYLRRESRPDSTVPSDLTNLDGTAGPMEKRGRGHADILNPLPTSPDARDGIQRAREAKSRAQSIASGENGARSTAADSGYGRSPKVFPGELRAINGAFGTGKSEDKSGKASGPAGEQSFAEF